MSRNADEIERINRLLDESKNLSEDIKKGHQQAAEALKDASDAGAAFENIARAIKRDVADSAREATELRDAFAASVDELKNMNAGSNRVKKALSGLENIAQKLLDDQKGYNRLTLDQVKGLQDQIKVKLDDLKLSKTILSQDKERLLNGRKFADLGKVEKKNYNKIVAAQKAANAELNETDSLSKELAKTAKLRQIREEKVNEKLGLGFDIAKGITKNLSKLGIPDLGIGEALKKTKDVGLATKNVGKNFKPLKTFAKEFGKGLKANLSVATMTQAAFTMLIDAVIGADKATGDLAKNMNMTYEEANKTRHDMTMIAMSSGDIAINTEGIQKSQMAINDALGTNVMLNKEDLVTMTKLQKTAGLTSDEMVGIQKLTLGTNKSLKEATGEIMAQAKISSVKNGVVLTEKQILKEIKDVSAATTLSLGKNPKALAEAVAQAKALGMNMAQVEQIAGNLLDFESSIQNELEAELLTGKQINLEKAREAALSNDLATVAAEVADQVGNAAEFGEMNRLQQEAIAKSVGMSRDDLAKTLFTQEQLVGLSGDQAKERQKLLDQRIEAVGLEQAQKELAEQGIEGLENQNSKAEQFAQLQEKIKDTFTAMAPAILQIVDFISLILTPIAKIFEFISFTTEMATKLGETISNFLGPLGMVGKFLKGVAKIAVIFAAYKAFSSLASIPIIGVPLGVAAAAAVTSAGFGLLNAIKVGDLMSQAKGKTQVSTKEGGLFELSPNDDLVAAPGAADAMTKKGEKSGKGEGNAALIAEVKTLIGINRQILAKSPVIEMNGNKVGEEINQSERRVQ